MNKILFAMAAAGLALLGIVRALSIDNQLTVVKHDCYERIAIGQRLNAKDVYKSFNYTTLDECRLACTQQRNACKAFSFGISSKGNNATCELSLTPVKETPDLKPIGTILDTDFDLYIKKLGCSLVLDDKNHNDDNKPDTLGNIKPDQTTAKHESEKVQALVSVASGPNSYLHPIHDILVSNSKDYGNLPPFRPDALNQPYDDRQSLKPRPDRTPYGSNSHYDGYHRPSYGDFHQDKPINDGYDKPISYPKPINDGYGGFNDDRRKPFDPPNSGYGGYNSPKPINDAYGSFNDNRYKPDYGGFNDPKPINNFNDDRHKPQKPDGYQNYPKPVNDGYDSFNDDRRKPLKPFHDPKPINDGYGSFNYDRRKPGAYPDPGYGGFDDPKPGPTKPNDYHAHYDRPDPYDYYYHYCDKPDHFHDGSRPNWDRYDDVKPARPNDRFSGYLRPIPNRYGSVIPHPDEYTRKPDDGDGYNKPPKRPDFNKEQIKPEGVSEKPGEDDNKNDNKNAPGKLMVTHSVGYHGQKITSIITELNDGKTMCCFRS